MTQLVKQEGGSYIRPDDPGEPGYNVPRVSITDQEGEILGDLASGRRVLEIGTGLGISTAALAGRARSVLTLDVDPWVIKNIWPDLQQRFCNIETATPDEMAEMDCQFDMAFIDGCHYTAAVVRDFELAKPRVLSPGLIVFHDAKYISLAAVFPDYDFLVLDTTHGLGILSLEREVN